MWAGDRLAGVLSLELDVAPTVGTAASDDLGFHGHGLGLEVSANPGK
jgi:hypothetical protein